MGSFFKKKFTLSLSVLIILVVFLMTFILIYNFYNEPLDSKLSMIYGGAVVASFFMLIQLILSSLDYYNNEKLQRYGVKGLLNKRDDKKYYLKLIIDAKLELNLLFHTGKRFFEDFCGQGGDDGFLIEQITKNKNLKVRVLLQNRNTLKESDQLKFDVALDFINVMKEKFPSGFEVRYYDGSPSHNIFASENDVIVGPYFEHVDGKYTHSMHFKRNAGYVMEYMEFFNREWNRVNNTTSS
jgi:hypothetical protein